MVELQRDLSCAKGYIPGKVNFLGWNWLWQSQKGSLLQAAALRWMLRSIDFPVCLIHGWSPCAAFSACPDEALMLLDISIVR